MEKQMYESMFENEKQDFTGEEITIFKRYIEENNVYTDSNFEYLEENLSYYSSRYTRENFISPFELFQVNSNYLDSDEMKKNVGLYYRSVEWSSKTVHPEDSEYVIKEEKYIYTEQLDEALRNLICELNKYPKSDYHCIDLLICYKENIYKYLSQKNFVFTWRKNCGDLIRSILKETYFQDGTDIDKETYDNSLIVLPIFVPIRQALFLGEYGYRNAIVNYGRIIERIDNFEKDKFKHKNIERFDNIKLNNLIGIDGVEKSIYNVLIFEERSN